jgi:Flp pilus assembly protein TadG
VTPAGARPDDRGAGAFSTAIGFLVFLTCLFLAVQVVFGLYATSVVRATLSDAASRAAGGGGAGDAELAALAAEAEANLGAIGRQPSTVVELELEDTDGDGIGDVVAGRAVVEPPRFAPAADLLGFDVIEVAVRMRVERDR